MTRRDTTRSYLEAELATVEDLLASMPEDRVMERMGFESRRDEIRAQLAALERGGQEAEVDLLFEGQPVAGSEGIDVKFASEMLAVYQDLVAGVSASRQRGALSAAGPLPAQRSSRLFITGFPLGSFGFELRELSSMVPLFDSSLRIAVKQVTDLLIATADSDDAFSEAVDDLDQRIFASLASFFGVLHKWSATIKIRVDRDYRSLDAEHIAAAAERSAALRVAEEDVPMQGRFMGVLLDSRRFEHELPTGTVIRGKADTEADIAAMTQWVARDCIAHVRVLSWTRAGKEYRRYTLLRLSPP